MILSIIFGSTLMSALYLFVTTVSDIKQCNNTTMDFAFCTDTASMITDAMNVGMIIFFASVGLMLFLKILGNNKKEIKIE